MLKLRILAGVVAAGCLAAGCALFARDTSSSEYAVGEEHQVPYPADQTFIMTQDVLRGEGVLFDINPSHEITTMWRPADTPAGTVASLLGAQARYRYEMQIAPDGDRRAKIVVNLRAENIPDDQVANYKASKRLDLFAQFDQLAANLPPQPSTPGSGGVNFTILPGENLMGLSKRVTGNPDNWRQIAKDNGLKSVDDIAGVPSVWVSYELLPQKKRPAASPTSISE